MATTENCRYCGAERVSSGVHCDACGLVAYVQPQSQAQWPRRILLGIVGMGLLVIGLGIYREFFTPKSQQQTAPVISQSQPAPPQPAESASGQTPQSPVSREATSLEARIRAARAARETENDQGGKKSLESQIEKARTARETGESQVSRTEVKSEAKKEVATQHWNGPAWGAGEWMGTIAAILIAVLCLIAIFAAARSKEDRLVFWGSLVVLVFLAALTCPVVFGDWSIGDAYVMAFEILVPLAALGMATMLGRRSQSFGRRKRELQHQLEAAEDDDARADVQSQIDQIGRQQEAFRNKLVTYGVAGGIALAVILAVWLFIYLQDAGRGIMSFFVGHIIAIAGMYFAVMLVMMLFRGFKDWLSGATDSQYEVALGALEKKQAEIEHLYERIGAYTEYTADPNQNRRDPKAMIAVDRAEDRLEKLQAKRKEKVEEMKALEGQLKLVSYGPWAGAFLYYWGDLCGVRIYPNPIDNHRAQVAGLTLMVMVVWTIVNFGGFVHDAGMINPITHLKEVLGFMGWSPISWLLRTLIFWPIARAWMRGAMAEEEAQAATAGHPVRRRGSHFWDMFKADFVANALVEGAEALLSRKKR